MLRSPIEVHGSDVRLSSAERRDKSRTRTVYRIARVRACNDEGLARIRNISDGGMRLKVGIPVVVGENIEIEISETLALIGCVVWSEAGECGIQFAQPVDSMSALRLSAEEARTGLVRPLRLSGSLPAVVQTEHGLRITHLLDISQRGMKIAHDGSFTPGLVVKVTIGPGLERRGCVRWVGDRYAGLMLTEPFAVEELGSVSALCA